MHATGLTVETTFGLVLRLSYRHCLRTNHPVVALFRSRVYTRFYD